MNAFIHCFNINFESAINVYYWYMLNQNYPTVLVIRHIATSMLTSMLTSKYLQSNELL